MVLFSPGRRAEVIAYVIFAVAALLLLMPHLLAHGLHHDEALAIQLGRAWLAGLPCDGACAQHTGSVLIHPVLAALGDRWGGLYGARMVSVTLGMALLAMVVAVGRLLMGPTGGWLTGLLLLTQAPFLYVSRMALYDVAAGAFLGLALLALVAADRARGVAVGAWLLTAAVALVGMSLAKYVAVIFVPAALAMVWWRFLPMQALLWFTVPLLALGGWVFWQLLPFVADLLGQARNVTVRGQAAFSTGEVLGMLVRWMGWLLLLALAGWGLGRARLPGMEAPRDHALGPARWPVWFLLAATLLPLLHLMMGAVQGLNKNLVLSLTLLAPAAAYGLLRLSQPFHVGRNVNAQWVVIALVLGLLAWGGLRQKVWLEHQYPNLSPVVTELTPLVGPLTVVMTDTDALFRYALEGRIAPAQVVLTYWVDFEGAAGEEGAVRSVGAGRPDYVVLDDYYGQALLHERLKGAMDGRYQLRRRWPMALSWGERSVELYERKGAAE